MIRSIVLLISLCCVHGIYEINSPADVEMSDPNYDTEFWGVVDFKPVPAYVIDTHDPVTQDQYVSASVYEAKAPWDSFIWDRIVSLSLNGSGLVFVDVGANIGYFSLQAASMGYNVVAFEPMSRNAQKLARSIQHNEFDSHVTLYQNVVSDVSGQEMGLTETDATNQGNGQGHGVDYATSVTLSEALMGIDAFIVKIDVEGREVEVLRGATSWICHNVIRHVIMEVSDATRRDTRLMDMLVFMRSAGYTLADVAVGSRVIDSLDIIRLPPNVIFSLVADRATC